MSLVSEEALGAHCRRVAGWAKQAAHKVDCSTAELQALERAALLHHAENLVLRPKAFAAIAGDLQVEISEGPPCSELYSGMTLEILQAYNSPGPAASRPAELAKILEWADQFDETFELSAIDPLPADELAGRDQPASNHGCVRGTSRRPKPAGFPRGCAERNAAPCQRGCLPGGIGKDRPQRSDRGGGASESGQ